MFSLFQSRYGDVVGSEFLGSKVPWGKFDARGIRNETVTRLSFDSQSFSNIVSFDVLEHVPDYEVAFREFFRVLKPGGSLLFSVPFHFGPQTTTRARVDDSVEGGVVHLLPPEYHGDPVTDTGCLCFYHFGFDLLDVCKSAGFAEAHALLYYDSHFGYLGFGEQVVFLARKGLP